MRMCKSVGIGIVKSAFFMESPKNVGNLMGKGKSAGGSCPCFYNCISS